MQENRQPDRAGLLLEQLEEASARGKTENVAREKAKQIRASDRAPSRPLKQMQEGEAEIRDQIPDGPFRVPEEIRADVPAHELLCESDENSIIDETVKDRGPVFLDDQAGVLAAGLAEGSPCPVCGSREHPSPAKRGGKAPSEAELDTMKAELDSRRTAASALSAEASALKASAEELEKNIGGRLSECTAVPCVR